jgi:CubicO group peptidase (beta-lactamase class C family)
LSIVHFAKTASKLNEQILTNGVNSMKAVLYFLTLACALPGANLQAQVPELEGLEAFMLEAMSISHTPGAAIAVVRGDKVIYSQGFGVSEVGKGAPVDGDTLFAIGSNTKHFTATAVGLLVNDGKLDWDGALTRYLPNLRFSDPYLFTEATLRDALSHRTGLARAEMAWYSRPGISRGEVLAIIEHLPREIGFRSGFLYNNYMFLAAGEIIPAVSGKSWDDTLVERIFIPLNMTRSNTSVDDLSGMTNVAMPHTMVEGKALPIPYYNLDHLAPAGSINSSVNDMAQWCKVQLANGKLGEQQVIPEAVIKEVRQPHNLLPLAPKGHRGNIHVAYALGIGRIN